MKICYICGPFRGRTTWRVENNVRDAEEMMLLILQQGIMCFCPHTNTRFFDSEVNDSFIINGCLEMVKRCDCLFAMQPALTSGMQAEIDLARSLKLPIFYEISDLVEWCNESNTNTSNKEVSDSSNS